MLGLVDRPRSLEAHQVEWPLRLVNYCIVNLRSRWQAMPRKMVKSTQSSAQSRRLECRREHVHLHHTKRQEVQYQVDPDCEHDPWSHRWADQEPLERTPQAALRKYE